MTASAATADLRLAARLVDVPVQAQHGLIFLQRVPDRGRADPGDRRHAALHHRAELLVEDNCLVDHRVTRRHVKVEDRPVGAAERLGLLGDVRGELFRNRRDKVRRLGRPGSRPAEKVT
jgi:hypothetical protein